MEAFGQFRHLSPLWYSSENCTCARAEPFSILYVGRFVPNVDRHTRSAVAYLSTLYSIDLRRRTRDWCVAGSTSCHGCAAWATAVLCHRVFRPTSGIKAGKVAAVYRRDVVIPAVLTLPYQDRETRMNTAHRRRWDSTTLPKTYETGVEEASPQTWGDHDVRARRGCHLRRSVALRMSIKYELRPGNWK